MVELENILKFNGNTQDLSEDIKELDISDRIKKIITESQNEILFEFGRSQFRLAEYHVIKFSNKTMITISLIFKVNFIQYDLFIHGDKYEIKNIFQGNHYTDDYTKVQTKDKKLIYIKSYDNRKESKILIQKKFFGYKKDTIYYCVKYNKKSIIIKNLITDEEVKIHVEKEIILRRLLNNLEKFD